MSSIFVRTTTKAGSDVPLQVAYTVPGDWRDGDGDELIARSTGAAFFLPEMVKGLKRLRYLGDDIIYGTA